MNKEPIILITKPKKQLIEKDNLEIQINNYDNSHLYYKGFDLGTFKEIENLQQENKQLKDNWNNLKKWLEKELGDRTNPNKDKWLTGVYDAYRETIDKMQELEQGSDSND